MGKDIDCFYSFLSLTHRSLNVLFIIVDVYLLIAVFACVPIQYSEGPTVFFLSRLIYIFVLCS